MELSRTSGRVCKSSISHVRVNTDKHIRMHAVYADISRRNRRATTTYDQNECVQRVRAANVIATCIHYIGEQFYSIFFDDRMLNEFLCVGKLFYSVLKIINHILD